MDKSGSRKILAVIVSAFTALGASASAVMPKAEKSSIIQTFAEEETEDYHTWSQLDPRWSSVTMGGSTIGSSGCLITSLSIMAMHSGSLDSAALANLGISNVNQFNPGVLANAYTSVGGFNQWGGIASWGTIHQLIPSINFIQDSYLNSYSQSDIAAEIAAKMANGQHIILNANGHHWVYITGVSGDQVYMCDPANDSTNLFDIYSPGGCEYWALTAKNPPDQSYQSQVQQPLYEASADIEILSLPYKTEYSVGEELDLSGGYAVVSYVDPYKGYTQLQPEYMSGGANAPQSYAVNTSLYDPNTPGTYSITLSADTGYATVVTSFTVTVVKNVQEYYYTGEEKLDVFSEKANTGSVVAVLSKDSVVQIEAEEDGYGKISSDDLSGWVELSQLTDAGASVQHIKGDINNDGNIDKYDLYMLNDYLEAKSKLVSGISTLRQCELDAADINGDGIVNSSDVVEMLNKILN